MRFHVPQKVCSSLAKRLANRFARNITYIYPPVKSLYGKFLGCKNLTGESLYDTLKKNETISKTISGALFDMHCACESRAIGNFSSSSQSNMTT